MLNFACFDALSFANWLVFLAAGAAVRAVLAHACRVPSVLQVGSPVIPAKQFTASLIVLVTSLMAASTAKFTSASASPAVARSSNVQAHTSVRHTNDGHPGPGQPQREESARER